jgi:hypothetical protein
MAGGVEGDRTPDLLIANETLYQLSYNPSIITYSQLAAVWSRQSRPKRGHYLMESQPTLASRKHRKTGEPSPAIGFE